MQFVVRTTSGYDTLLSVMSDLQTEAQKSGLFIFTNVDLRFDTQRLGPLRCSVAADRDEGVC